MCLIYAPDNQSAARAHLIGVFIANLRTPTLTASVGNGRHREDGGFVATHCRRRRRGKRHNVVPERSGAAQAPPDCRAAGFLFFFELISAVGAGGSLPEPRVHALFVKGTRAFLSTAARVPVRVLECFVTNAALCHDIF